MSRGSPRCCSGAPPRALGARRRGAAKRFHGRPKRPLVGPDSRRGQTGGREQLGRQLSAVLDPDCVDSLDRFVDGQDRQLVHHRGAETAHARSGGLQSEHDAALEVLARALQLLLARRVLDAALELVRHHLERLREVLRARADIHADLARAGIEV